MHDNDPEITVLIPGIIVEPSLQEKYVNHSKENIHDQTGNLQSPLLLMSKVPHDLQAFAPLAICSVEYTKMEYLNIHAHQESDNDRIVRLTETYQTVVYCKSETSNNSDGCSKCGKKEDGEVELKEEKEYKMKSWEGPNGETAGYLIDGGKNIAFSQSAVEKKKLFTSNREHEIGIYKFS